MNVQNIFKAFLLSVFCCNIFHGPLKIGQTCLYKVSPKRIDCIHPHSFQLRKVKIFDTCFAEMERLWVDFSNVVCSAKFIEKTLSNVAICQRPTFSPQISAKKLDDTANMQKNWMRNRPFVFSFAHHLWSMYFPKVIFIIYFWMVWYAFHLLALSFSFFWF